MFSVSKLLWFSLFLLLFTNALLSWLLSTAIPELTDLLIFLASISFSLSLSSLTAYYLIMVIAVITIMVMIIILTIPNKLIKSLFGGFLESDNKAVISFLFWSIIFVISLSQFELFIRFLILLSALLLARLETQIAGYSQQLSCIIILGTSLMGFALGILGYHLYGYSIYEF